MFIKCSECGEEFSNEKKACPNCGCHVEEIEETKEEIISENELLDENLIEENASDENDVVNEDVLLNEENISNEDELKKICLKCGNVLNEDEFFCRKCGRKYIEKEEYNKRKKYIVGALIVVVSIILCTVFKIQYDKEQLIKAKEAYIESVNTFAYNITDYASDSEETISTTLRYWNENIWEDKHGNTIDDAILRAFTENYSLFRSCQENEESIETSYKEISSIPEGLEEDTELLSLKQSAKELYSAYKQLNELAINPTGSYTSYSQEKSDLVSNFNEKKSNLESNLY